MPFRAIDMSAFQYFCTPLWWMNLLIAQIFVINGIHFQYQRGNNFKMNKKIRYLLTFIRPCQAKLLKSGSPSNINSKLFHNMSFKQGPIRIYPNRKNFWLHTSKTFFRYDCSVQIYAELKKNNAPKTLNDKVTSNLSVERTKHKTVSIFITLTTFC